jgi:hypothetical protein
MAGTSPAVTYCEDEKSFAALCVFESANRRCLAPIAVERHAAQCIAVSLM